MSSLHGNLQRFKSFGKEGIIDQGIVLLQVLTLSEALQSLEEWSSHAISDDNLWSSSACSTAVFFLSLF